MVYRPMVLVPLGGWPRPKAQDKTEAEVEVREGRHGGGQDGREGQSVGTVVEASMKLHREAILAQCEGNMITFQEKMLATAAKLCWRWQKQQLPGSWASLSLPRICFVQTLQLGIWHHTCSMLSFFRFPTSNQFSIRSFRCAVLLSFDRFVVVILSSPQLPVVSVRSTAR